MNSKPTHEEESKPNVGSTGIRLTPLAFLSRPSNARRAGKRKRQTERSEITFVKTDFYYIATTS